MDTNKYTHTCMYVWARIVRACALHTPTHTRPDPDYHIYTMVVEGFPPATPARRRGDRSP